MYSHGWNDATLHDLLGDSLVPYLRGCAPGDDTAPLNGSFASSNRGRAVASP